MAEPEKESPTKRQYPAFYEKLIPIAIGVLAVVVIGMFAYAIAVALGFIG